LFIYKNKNKNKNKFADVEYVGDWPFSLPSLELNYTKKLSKRESLNLETELGFEGLFALGLGYTRRLAKGNKLSITSGMGGNGTCTIGVSYIPRDPIPCSF
jgi:hypothetical protein